jgi:hypothetical protein
MNTINVQVPSTVSVVIKYHGSQTIDLEGKSPEWFAWAVAMAAKQSAGDADAGKAHTDEGKQAVLDKFTRIADGQVPQQGAGGGMKASPELVASRIVVANVLHNSFGYGKTDAKKVVKDNPWAVLFEHYVKEEAKESGEVLSDDDINELATDDNLEAVRQMHDNEYQDALSVAKGGSKKVTTTGFLKKS